MKLRDKMPLADARELGAAIGSVLSGRGVSYEVWGYPEGQFSGGGSYPGGGGSADGVDGAV